MLCSDHRTFDLSGINFYVESGYLSVGIKETPRLRNIKANVEARCHNVKYLSYSQLVERYPYMSFGQLDEGICPASDAGYINPRPLVKAQIELAKRYGCEAFDIIVDHISHNELDRHVLTLADGRKVVAKRVILATGGFTFCRSLMPRGIIPDVRLNPNTVILVIFNSSFSICFSLIFSTPVTLSAIHSDCTIGLT